MDVNKDRVLDRNEFKALLAEVDNRLVELPVHSKD